MDALKRVLAALSDVAEDRATSSWYSGNSDAYRDASRAVKDIVDEVLYELNKGQ